MKYSLIISLVAVNFYCYSQAPNLGWQETIGGSDSDFGRVALVTLDGGTIIGGSSISDISGDKTENSLGALDYWIVKLNEIGEIEWQNTIGGINNDGIADIDYTSDGGYILAGRSRSNISGDKTEDSRGLYDYWVVKINSIGEIEWDKTIGGEGSDEAQVIKHTNDGGYIIGGWSDSDASGEKSENCLGELDYWVVKLSSNGQLEWENTIGGSKLDNLFDIIIDSNGDYILAGFSESDISADKSENSLGLADYWIVKIDESGNIIWDNTIGGNASDRLFSIADTSDGNYFIAGHSSSNISGDKTEPNIGNEDVWVIKIDPSGQIIWQNTFGGLGFDRIYSEGNLRKTSDNGCIIFCSSNSDVGFDKSENSRGGFDYWIVKLNSEGEIEWDKTIGGDADEVSRSMLIYPNGKSAAVGRSNSSLSGDKTEENLGSWDYWIVTLNTLLNVESNEFLSDLIQVYPIPTSDFLHIVDNSKLVEEVRVFTLDGKILESYDKCPSILDFSSYKSGYYFIQFIGHDKVFNKKILKL